MAEGRVGKGRDAVELQDFSRGCAPKQRRFTHSCSVVLGPWFQAFADGEPVSALSENILERSGQRAADGGDVNGRLIGRAQCVDAGLFDEEGGLNAAG